MDNLRRASKSGTGSSKLAFNSGPYDCHAARAKEKDSRAKRDGNVNTEILFDILGIQGQ